MKPLKASIPLFLVLSVLTLTFTFLAVPVSSRVATGSYYLDTPLPIASYYVGQYSNDTYFAVNGSNWQNFIRSTNASYVFETVIGNMTDGGRFFVGAGNYTLTTTISITMALDYQLIIEGEGKDTILFGELEKMLDIANVAHVGGNDWGSLTLKNLRFHHVTQSASSIGLDLMYSNTNLDDVVIVNKYGSNRGTGIKIGPKQNSGQMFWRNIEVMDYDTAFDISIDHLTGEGIQCVRPVTYGFYIHENGWTTLTNSFILHWEPSSVCEAFHFKSIDIHTSLYGVYIEGNSTGSQFNYTDTRNRWVDVWGFGTYTIYSTLIESGSYVRLHNYDPVYYPHISSAYSYTVFKSESTYYAQNGTTGSIDYSDTNATYVVNTCIENMDNGTTLFLKEATYDLGTSSIMVWWNKSIAIEGEGVPFSIGGVSDGGGVKLSYSGSGFAIDTYGPHVLPPTANNNTVAQISLKRLGIITGGAGSGIHLFEFNSGFLSQISMMGTSPNEGTVGLKLNATGNSEEWLCEKIEITEFDKAIQPNQQHMTWISVEISNCNYGVYPEYNIPDPFWGEGGYSEWIGLHLIEIEYVGFRFIDHYTTLIAPHVEGILDATGDAFLFDSSHSFHVIENPYFTNVHADADFVDINTAGQVAIRCYDTDYLTQKTSSSEASNDDWIAHSLAGTPDFVHLTVMESDSAYSIQLKASNSTHFQIYLYDIIAAGVEVVDKTITWEAVYQP